MDTNTRKTIVVKLGGSTLGSHDTTLEDLVTLQKRGVAVVVVHGGAKVVTEWLKRMGIETKSVRGLRVTDAETLKVVTAVLAGLVNKELVTAVQALGGKAVGLSCADGGMTTAWMKHPELGYVGDVAGVDCALLNTLLDAGYIPIVSPLSQFTNGTAGGVQLANMNGDTVAGALAAALQAERLVFLTDVPGIYDAEKKVMPKLSAAEAQRMVSCGTISSGMLPKIESCLSALSAVEAVRVIDGRSPHALLLEVEGKGSGTTVAR